MKYSALLFATSVAAAPHYIFPSIQGNSDWETVRITANHYSNAPVTDVTSDAIRCYQLNPGDGGDTKVTNIKAGQNITFTANPNMYHPGALSAYMAHTPIGTEVAKWDGSGTNWFKIYQDMPDKQTPYSMEWPNHNKKEATFTIPECIADGEYLFRVEHVALHSAASLDGAQFYIGCAQINVTGGAGTKKPDDLVAFPGAYKNTDPGLHINIYNNKMAKYQPAGPSVFSC